jgi:general secretion pathway protein D
MLRRTLAVIFTLLVAACAGQRVYEEGVALIDEGRVADGLARIEEASRLEPSNREYRQAYFRQRDLALQRYLALADQARQQGQWEAAEKAYQAMLGFDPQNARAQNGLDALKTERRHRVVLAQAEELFKRGEGAAANAKVREVLAQNGANREAQQLLRRIEERALRAAAAGPQLAASLKEPISMAFRDTSLKQVFDLLARNTGLNFVFDRDVRPDLRTTIFVRNSSVEDILRFILVTNQLERKVLSENTVLIFPNTPAKLRDYQDLVVKTFYLANTDAKTVGNMLRTMVKTKDIHIDEKLNIVVVRDTPAAVLMAERLIANQDLAEPEVMLEVEVMEVSRNTLYNMGIQYPGQISADLVGAAGTVGTLTLPEWLSRSSGLVRLTFSSPFLALNFNSQIGRSNLLANPRIRVKNKEKAKVHIGDKVPVITTTTTATGFVSESVTYLDVGLKLEVEPVIHLEDDVDIKIGLEVSSIVREIKSASGTLTYQVGTRNAATSLRLRDGETQVLAGLISDEDRKTANQVPGLGSIPVLGRLFGSHQDTVNKSEIVLLITPRVVRNLARPELRFEQFPGGTEASVGAAPLVLTSYAPTDAPQGKPVALVPASAKVTLQGPATVLPGQEFAVVVSIDSAAALKSGLLDFGFDPAGVKFVRAEPGAMLITADKDAAFRTNAPEGIGRMNLSFASKNALKGSGEIARVTFQLVGPGAAVRLEATSFTSAAGQILQTQLPPPLILR